MVNPNRQSDWKSTNKHGLITGPKTSQLYREMMGVMSLSPYDGNNSESRKQMFGSHIGQRLTISGATERRIQTGMEREYGKYTFALRMPVTGTIIKLIERYPSTLGMGGIAHNPEILVIYENDETKEVGCFSIVEHFTHHPYFGFKYKRRAAMSMLRPGESIREGTILQDSPAIAEDGGYHYGREMNVAYMSIPGVSEDGVVISRDMLKYFATKKYETRVVEFGKNYIPTNLYGDEFHFKAHPDIGDPIGLHGILMNLRLKDENLAPVEQSINSTRRINPTFDRKIYADGPGGRVVDIRVQHDPNSTAPITPQQMVGQTSIYDRARRRFYQEILNEYYRLKKNRGGALNISPEFHRWVTEAISVVNPTSRREGSDGSERVSKLYKGVPLDDWRIEFVIEYDVLPTIGFKVTDTHGGKGVICQICEPHEMPVDAAGNRADMVMSPEARVSRMNLGGLIEPFVNATARDLVVDLTKQFGLEANPKAVNENYISSHPYFQTAWERLMRFYEITSPKHMRAGFASEAYAAEGGTPQYHVCSVIKDGIYLYSPPENEIYIPKMVKELEAEYPSVYGPVTYIGNSGIRRTTVENVRIGSMYIMLLEKIGDDWAAVSSGKWQNFGVLAQITNRDKYATATREQATRAWGEAEFRIAKANIPGNIVAEIHDRNNNILSHREVLWSLYRADHPSNIRVAVDRNKIPYGQARSLQLVKHLAFCGGWEFKYSPYRSDVEIGITDEDWAKEVKE